jgi:hypothetical protein
MAGAAKPQVRGQTGQVEPKPAAVAGRGEIGETAWNVFALGSLLPAGQIE